MQPGNGYRLANDVLLEISLHFAQPIVYTFLLANVTVGSNTVAIGSLGIPTSACYIGAQLLVTDPNNGNEVITLTNVGAGVITATFIFAHQAGTVISGATWPLQQATDPVFTQAEMISYLSRAQNEILSKFPCVYQISPVTAIYNTIFYSAPSNMIEMERISFSVMSQSGVSLSRNGTGTVTATFPSPHGLILNQMLTVFQATNSTFLGAFQINDVVSNLIVTWPQIGTAASSATSTVGIFNRLYEITQEEQAFIERTWRSDTFLPPTGWFEDRSGNYGYGLNARPQGSFPMNLIYSIRDNDVLTLADGFVLPDIFVYLAKYKAMEYAYTKDGVWQSPRLAKYCKMRVDRGILIARRFFEGEQIGLGKEK